MDNNPSNNKFQSAKEKMLAKKRELRTKFKKSTEEPDKNRFKATSVSFAAIEAAISKNDNTIKQSVATKSPADKLRTNIGTPSVVAGPSEGSTTKNKTTANKVAGKSNGFSDFASKSQRLQKEQTANKEMPKI